MSKRFRECSLEQPFLLPPCLQDWLPESHLARLREGRAETMESSSLHLDVLRDLKRIHSHICSVAYGVLERAGELQPSRLKDVESESTLVAQRNPTLRAR